MTLTEDQDRIHKGIIEDIKEALNGGDVFCEHTFLALSGPGGSGKTFLSDTIVRSLIEDMNLKVAVLAPTHKALKVIRSNISVESINLTFATVHSFLGLKPKIDNKTGAQSFVKDTSPTANKTSKIKVDVMIIDESSFISTSLFEHIKKELLVYGRVKIVLFIGDPNQLLPVEDNNDLNENDVKAKAAVFSEDSSNIINHYKLTEVIRNGNTEVLDFYTTVRKMIESKATRQDFYHFLRSEQAKEHKKIVFFENKQDFIKQYILKDRIKDESDVIVTFTNTNVNSYNKSIRDYYIKKHYGEVPELHLDDLFVVQSSDEQFINSETIELKSFIEKDIMFMGKSFKGYYCTTTDNRTFNYLKEESRDDYERALGLLKANAIQKKDRVAWSTYYSLVGLFIELKYVYSSTCHKAQGSTMENVYVDMSNINYVDDDQLLRLFYVGVTRSKDSVYILL